MCIMEEMQWMRTRPISAANFFHGTLEVIERDIPVILIKGEDKTRPEMDRVEKFVNTISANVTGKIITTTKAIISLVRNFIEASPFRIEKGA